MRRSEGLGSRTAALKIRPPVTCNACRCRDWAGISACDKVDTERKSGDRVIYDFPRQRGHTRDDTIALDALLRRIGASGLSFKARLADRISAVSATFAEDYDGRSAQVVRATP